jgi:DNA-binding winged helix-turn-helix (wHTH) protein/tetratricopeptide (TPR) repeat protein
MRSARQSTSEVELDLGRYELRRSGRRVRLERKPMDLLIFLVSRRGQMVSREEIIKKLWRSDLFIDSDRNLNNIIRKIRTALADSSDKPRFLETVVGKGYRFIGPVRVIDAQFGHRDLVAGARHREDVRGAERVSLAVVPLINAGKTPDDGICLGFADALVSRLGNLQGVDVLPASSVLNLPSALTPAEAASYLGTRFVVYGAIQMSKGQWRLSVQMFDSHSQTSCFSKSCDFDINSLPALEKDMATQIAEVLKRPLPLDRPEQFPRYSRDHLAYAEFMRGYQLSSSGDPSLIEKASHHLIAAVTRDPNFALAHATLSYVCAVCHFEHDPASTWLEKAEFHCRRALDVDSNLAEAYVARAFLAWGPSKNFQHLEAIGDLKHALKLQNNLPHAYNRLGTILAHIGLLERAREMYEKGRLWHPKRAVSPSIVQVHIWRREHELAREAIAAWLEESPGNKYAIYFAPQPAMMTGDWEEATRLVEEAVQLLPEEPLIISLQGLLYAMTGKQEAAQDCVIQACSNPKSFGHAHHTYYQIACIQALAGKRENAFAWLERSLNSGFACWPFFLRDPCLQNLHGLPEFQLLVSSLQARYPDHLGLL